MVLNTIISKSSLINLCNSINLVQLLHHSDRGSQYASKAYRKQLETYAIVNSMSGKGNCYDNAVVERFFGSLKHEWLVNVINLTREGMINDVNHYIRYYNEIRLHSTLGYQCPIEYENSRRYLCD